MDEIKVQVKYSNREYPRVYKVTGGSFDAMKELIKTNGGKYDGNTRRWSINKSGLDSIKTAFRVESADFQMDYKNHTIDFCADNRTIWAAGNMPVEKIVDGTAVVVPADDSEKDAKMLSVFAEMKAEYSKSDDAFFAHVKDGQYK